MYFKYKNRNIKCLEFNVFTFTFDKILSRRLACIFRKVGIPGFEVRLN